MTINEQITAGVENIVLTEDVTENVVIPAGRTVTIDLAGYTIQNDISDNANEYTISNSGTLVIEDSVGTGAVYNAGTKLKGCLVNLKGGIVELNGGKFWTDAPRSTGAWYYIVNLGKFMTINDPTDVPGVAPNASTVRNGFYTAQEREENYVEGVNPRLIINGGNFTGQLIPVKNDNEGVIEINGGTFEGPSECVLNWNYGTINGGTFTSPSNKYCVFSGSCAGEIGCNGQLDVNGGTFIGGAGIYDLSPQYDPQHEYPDAHNYVTGGMWKVTNKSTVTDFIKPGFDFKIDEDGNIIVEKEIEWTLPEGGKMGLGMIGQYRVYAHNDSVEYVAGGFDVPVRYFTPRIVIAMAQGGCDGYYNPDTKKIQLYRNGEELDDQRIFDVTLLMFGQ